MKLFPSLKRIGAALLAAALLTVIAFLGVLNRPDRTVSDLVYEPPASTEHQITVIGLSAFTYSSSREVTHTEVSA